MRSLGATGGTMRDLENSYLTIAGDNSPFNLRARYAVFAASGTQDKPGRQKVRDKFAS